ncbi:MAG TPA: arginine--tRNA ligase [Thermomicrobiales bacterium]
MDYALDRFRQQARAAILATGIVAEEDVELVTPNPNVPADLAFPLFRAGKRLGTPPPRLAVDLAAAIHPTADGLLGAAVASGPYLNLTLNMPRFAAEVLAEIERPGPRYGHDDLGAGQTVVVDYSAPNVAKRMHVGHIRSTIIGQAIVNILGALGYRTVGDNHLGDWGKSFGVLLTGIAHEGVPTGDGESLLASLESLYVDYSGRAGRDPALDAESRAWSLRLEQGDPTARQIWQHAVDLTAGANQPSYDRLGVHFDHAYGESFYEPMLADLVQEALAKGVARPGEGGAVVVDLGDGLPTFLLQRGDGGTLYHTRDLATIVFRLREFDPSKIVYVIGEPQTLYLRQLFALARPLGYARDVEFVHVPFGSVVDATGRALSTRRGNMLYLQTLLDEAHARARAVVDRSGVDLPNTEKEAIAEIVGVGAVVYNDVSQNPRRTITLDWDSMLNLEGNSAPYIQYMYARCRSILRRAADESPPEVAGAVPPVGLVSPLHPSEAALVKHLAQLPIGIRAAGADFAPSEIAGWAYATARAFAAFYRDCPVLQAAESEQRAGRLRLVAATARALENGTALLGITMPDRM